MSLASIARVSPFRRRSSVGFTLIEVLLVLGIFAGLTAVAFAVYPLTRDRGHVNDTSRDLASLVPRVEDSFAATSYRAFSGSASGAVLASIFPKHMVHRDGGNVRVEHAWGGEVELLPAGGRGWAMRLHDIPARSCSGLLTSVAPMFSVVAVNSTVVKGDASQVLDVSGGVRACAEGGTVILGRGTLALADIGTAPPDRPVTPTNPTNPGGGETGGGTPPPVGTPGGGGETPAPTNPGGTTPAPTNPGGTTPPPETGTPDPVEPNPTNPVTPPDVGIPGGPGTGPGPVIPITPEPTTPEPTTPEPSNPTQPVNPPGGGGGDNTPSGSDLAVEIEGPSSITAEFGNQANYTIYIKHIRGPSVSSPVVTINFMGYSPRNLVVSGDGWSCSGTTSARSCERSGQMSVGDVLVISASQKSLAATMNISLTASISPGALVDTNPSNNSATIRTSVTNP